jgi:hypothetical protein
VSGAGDRPPKPTSFRDDGSGAIPPSHSRADRGEFRPEKVVNPPPKFLPVAYRLPPEPMLEAVLAAFASSGIVLVAIDRAEGLVSGEEEMAPGVRAAVSVHVVATDAGGSRLLCSYDRPPGTRMDPASDERRLKALLDAVDAALAGTQPL